MGSLTVGVTSSLGARGTTGIRCPRFCGSTKNGNNKHPRCSRHRLNSLLLSESQRMRVAHSLGARGIERIRYSRLCGFIQSAGNEHPRCSGHRGNSLLPLSRITQYGSNKFLRFKVCRRNSLLPCLCIHEKNNEFPRCSGHRKSSLLLWVCGVTEKEIANSLGAWCTAGIQHRHFCGFAQEGSHKFPRCSGHQ